MKKQFLSIAFIALSYVTFSQSPLPKGKLQLNAGAGFSSWGIPVYIGADLGIHKDVTVGLEGTFRSYRDRYNERGYSHSIIGICGNANYHFNSLMHIPTNFDFYVGGNVGFNIWMSPSDYGGPNTSGLGFGGQVGGRYYFNEKLGINLEFNSGNSVTGGKIGISYKL